jgi:hypothetical protein
MKPQPYLIQPANEHEARFGKPTLLTDSQIATILDAIGLLSTQHHTDEQSVVLAELYQKLLPLWDTDAPYRGEGKNNEFRRTQP